eukprot:4819025-Ditylum_brightwellii.AAC.1
MIEKGIIETVPRSQVPTYQKVLHAIWSHRCKTKPTDGSRQIADIDYNEIYSPVVEWSTIRILLILAQLIGFKTRQVGYVQAFPRATLENEEIFIDIPTGFYYKDSDSTQKFVLKLKKNLYGLKQASYTGTNYLKLD